MRWFQLHPGIKRWHERVIKSISTRRYVENRFGYRLYIFDRVDTMVPEAVAWVPQSTVAHYINEIWMKVYLEQPDTQVLLQVHDSLAGQFPSSKRSECLEGLACAARSISVPYDDPLVIPFSIKTSMVSWGDCK
jgi:DNA polymerase I-like protein with 3'-5' exonuclease and polymerase domains